MKTLLKYQFFLAIFFITLLMSSNLVSSQDITPPPLSEDDLARIKASRTISSSLENITPQTKIPSQLCWNNEGNAPPQPSNPPQPFLYKPFNGSDWVSGWNSVFDHLQPIYVRDGIVGSLGEILSSANATKITYAGTADYYLSPSLEEYLGYDGHDGQDFGVAGDALAAASGDVVRVNYDNIRGNYIDIYHPQNGGYLTRYMHLASTNVTATSDVVAGQKIGVIGTTGNSTGIHLHFSVYRWNSTRQEWQLTDPFGWDPWLSPSQQINDPLYGCNGEISYGLWVDGWPRAVGGSPETPTAPTNAHYIGGWLGDFSASLTCPDYWPGNNVILFRDVQCSSDANNRISFSSAGFTNLSNFNDATKSIHVSPNWSVKIYEHNDRNGASRCITGPMWNLPQDNYDNGQPIVSNSNATISSIEVFQNSDCTGTGTGGGSGEVKLFALSGYSGNLLYQGGTGFSNDPNANSYSLQMPDGWSVKTWRGDNRSGEERCWSSSVNNLQDHGWQNAVQSLEAYNTNVCSSPPPPGSTSILICQTDDGNTCWSLPQTGIYDLSDGSDAFLNDTIRSVGVPSGQSVFLFVDTNMLGTGECFSGNRVPLPNEEPWNLRGRVTSLQAFDKSGCPDSDLLAVVLYDNQNFGSHHWGMGYTAGLRNVGDSSYQNDRAESIRIPEGMSVYLYADANGQGTQSSCLQGSRSSLDSLNNQVSSVEIFDNTSCTRPDTTPPTGKMISPVEFGAQNGMSMLVEATASDSGRGVNYVDFYAYSTAAWSNEIWVYLGSDNTAPYSINWDVSAIEDSHMYISANIIDNAGNESGLLWGNGNWTSHYLDNTIPSGNMTTPANDAIRSGISVTLGANSADNFSGVTQIDYYGWSTQPWADSQWVWLGSGTSSSNYQFSWDITDIPNGRVWVAGVVYDRAGNYFVMSSDEWTSFVIDSYDIDMDGIVSPTDVIFIVNRIGTTNLRADMDNDHDVDNADVEAALARLGQ